MGGDGGRVRLERADVQPAAPGGTSGKCEGCCAGRSSAKAAIQPRPWWPRGLLGAGPRVTVQGEGCRRGKLFMHQSRALRENPDARISALSPFT